MGTGSRRLWGTRTQALRGMLAALLAMIAVGVTIFTAPARGTPAATPSERSGPSQRVRQTGRRALLFQAVLNLRARGLDGTLWTHDGLRGRITLIDFWATWCAPCLREMPHLKRARARYGNRFRILGVSLDTMSRERLRSWLSRHQVGWPQIRAAGGYDDKLAVAFRIQRLPTTLLLDRQGRLRAVDVRGERLFDEIDRLLAEDSTR